jgi:hypothetical protein
MMGGVLGGEPPVLVVKIGGAVAGEPLHPVTYLGYVACMIDE